MTPDAAHRVIPRAILEAYRRTDYVVFAEPRTFTLRIGVPSEDLRAHLRAAGVSGACFVTAYNRFGAAMDEASNTAAQARLRAQLEALGLSFFAGEGRGEEPSWPAEPSFLVLGLDEEAATALCRQFEQNAVVHADASCVPRLLLHPELRAEA